MLQIASQKYITLVTHIGLSTVALTIMVNSRNVVDVSEWLQAELQRLGIENLRKIK